MTITRNWEIIRYVNILLSFLPGQTVRVNQSNIDTFLPELSSADSVFVNTIGNNPRFFKSINVSRTATAPPFPIERQLGPGPIVSPTGTISNVNNDGVPLNSFSPQLFKTADLHLESNNEIIIRDARLTATNGTGSIGTYNRNRVHGTYIYLISNAPIRRIANTFENSTNIIEGTVTDIREMGMTQTGYGNWNTHTTIDVYRTFNVDYPAGTIFSLQEDRDVVYRPYPVDETECNGRGCKYYVWTPWKNYCVPRFSHHNDPGNRVNRRIPARTRTFCYHSGFGDPPAERNFSGTFFNACHYGTQDPGRGRAKICRTSVAGLQFLHFRPNPNLNIEYLDEIFII